VLPVELCERSELAGGEHAVEFLLLLPPVPLLLLLLLLLLQVVVVAVVGGGGARFTLHLQPFT
jgi:hypothetical protein